MDQWKHMRRINVISMDNVEMICELNESEFIDIGIITNDIAVFTPLLLGISAAQFSQSSNVHPLMRSKARHRIEGTGE